MYIPLGCGPPQALRTGSGNVESSGKINFNKLRKHLKSDNKLEHFKYKNVNKTFSGTFIPVRNVSVRLRKPVQTITTDYFTAEIVCSLLHYSDRQADQFHLCGRERSTSIWPSLTPMLTSTLMRSSRPLAWLLMRSSV